MAFIEGEDIKLKSGRVIEADNGVLGIGPNLAIGGGYDHMITWRPTKTGPLSSGGKITPEDICELADIAIERWTRLKAFFGQQD